MDQPTKAISSQDLPSGCQANWLAGPKRRCLPQCPVRAVQVVVVGVLGQHRHQLPTSEDEHPVQQLPPDAAHPPLCVGVRPWRPHRRAQHPDPFSCEDPVERGGELGVPVADEKPDLADAVLEGHEQVAGLLGDPLPAGWGVTPSTWTRRLATSTTNRTYSRRSKTVATEKSTAATPAAWACRNWRQVSADRLGAGSTLARRRMVHTVLAPTLSL
jgi:hypothetical protein